MTVLEMRNIGGTSSPPLSPSYSADSNRMTLFLFARSIFPLAMKIGLFFLGQGLFLVALTVRSPHARKFFFPPIVVISIYLLFSPLKTGLPFIADYLFTCGHLSNVIIASDYLILTDVQATLRLKGQTVSISTLPFHSRLNWAIELVGSPRGIGWTHEPSKVLPKPRRAYERNDSLTKFTIDQVTRLSFYIFLFLLVDTYDKWDAPKQLHPLLLRPVNALVWVTPVIVFLDGVHRLLGLILVHARRLKPGDWIPLFGPWSEAYTIRRFWG